MLLIAKELQKAMREGTQDVNELAEYLMKNNSAWELAYSLAELPLFHFHTIEDIDNQWEMIILIQSSLKGTYF